MDELGPDEKPWLDALRSADEPTPADRARVRAAVMASIAAGAAGAGAVKAGAAALGKSGAVAKAAKVGLFAGAAWKIGIAAVVVSLAGGAVMMTRTHRAYRAPVASMTTAPSGVSTAARADERAKAEGEATAVAEAKAEAPGESLTVEAAPVVAGTRTPAGRPAAPRAAASGADDLDGELQLLTQAQHALERSDPTAALGALAQHRREHPHGALAVEREGLRAVASCEARRPDGKTLAERFVARNPSSPLVTRVRAACLSR